MTYVNCSHVTSMDREVFNKALNKRLMDLQNMGCSILDVKYSTNTIHGNSSRYCGLILFEETIGSDEIQ